MQRPPHSDLYITRLQEARQRECPLVSARPSTIEYTDVDALCTPPQQSAESLLVSARHVPNIHSRRLCQWFLVIKHSLPASSHRASNTSSKYVNITTSRHGCGVPTQINCRAEIRSKKQLLRHQEAEFVHHHIRLRVGSGLDS